MKKNLAYRRHWISCPLWIVAPIPKRGETDKQEKEEKYYFKCHVSGAACHMSCVTCRVSPVTCPWSLTPTATAKDPFPGNSPTMHSKLIPEDQKTQNKVKMQKIMETATKTWRGMPILVIASSTRSLQSRGEQGFQERTDKVTDIPTYRFNRSRDRFSENANI